MSISINRSRVVMLYLIFTLDDIRSEVQRGILNYSFSRQQILSETHNPESQIGFDARKKKLIKIRMSFIETILRISTKIT